MSLVLGVAVSSAAFLSTIVSASMPELVRELSPASGPESASEPDPALAELSVVTAATASLASSASLAMVDTAKILLVERRPCNGGRSMLSMPENASSVTTEYVLGDLLRCSLKFTAERTRRASMSRSNMSVVCLSINSGVSVLGVTNPSVPEIPGVTMGLLRRLFMTCW